MRIKATTAFTDKQAKTLEESHVPEGKEFTVTAERGAELVGLGLAVEVGSSSTAPAKTRKPRKTAEPVSPPPATPVPAVPAVDQDPQ